ncbi:MAG: glycoside hydrolase [candidate division Zixibacteria bacterium]|jgi:alpha-amylase/alpha-mannosidase (GH57 family)|nr:glycoside hydrolase [candidate division Zixibacteria bacterium]
MKLAFLWHMHQPFYKDLVSNRYEMPWVRLHGVKDYYDMPAILEKYPNIKQTFNLVPSLLEQIEEYSRGEAVDNHLELTAKPVEQLDDSDKNEIIANFFKANYDTMIRPHRRYDELYKKRLAAKEYYQERDWRDLQIWSNLAWVDPIFHKEKPIKELLAKGENYTEQDKAILLDFFQKTMGRIIPKYKQMADSGQIELSVTPYFHPILPLLCDTNIALAPRPQLVLPKHRFVHPEDAMAQINLAVDYFESRFGRKPTGMWPSEGSVSEQIIPLLVDAGIKWIATDEEILAMSLGRGLRSAGDDSLVREGDLYRPYIFETAGKSVHIFFRDHGISDLIGFVYSRMDAESAANDFIMRLEAIERNLRQKGKTESVVCVILDGENAWEYFPNDAHDFFDKLYRRLSEHPTIKTVTYSEAVKSVEPARLPRLHPGSWINHDYNVWIGHPEDNRAWDLLYAARELLAITDPSVPNYELAQKEIYIAEGSDWCWWFGDDHESPDNDKFDQLYRSHLKNVYRLLKKPIPPVLTKPIRSNFIMAHLMEPVDYIRPIIDGKLTHYYEWANAGYFDCHKAGSTMHKSERQVKAIFYGYGKDKGIYVRIDPIAELNFANLKVSIEFSCPEGLEITFANNRIHSNKPLDYLEAGFDKILEIAIKSPDIKGELSSMIVRIYDGETEIEKWPPVDSIPIRPELAAKMFWTV